jgi:BASS family bile acid:Na+ symporter
VIVILVPLALAQGLRAAAPGWTRAILRYRGISFYLWMGALFLITANASHFLLNQWHAEGAANLRLLGQLALTAAVICTVNFALGWKLGGSGGVAREVSQSLGQKNTMLTIWIALMYANPLVALGPTFYVLCHNSYNAWQLARCPDRSRKSAQGQPSQ